MAKTTKSQDVVTYTDADGNQHWAAEDSKAYQDHLREQDSKKKSSSSSSSSSSSTTVTTPKG